jgi:hypothetical protein|tara:strand:- start:219 stop:578 length:360 start_codon:yes stop_codon:yes gene_type:complete
MKSQELIKKHLTEGQNHIIKVTLHNRETLYSILKWWKTLSKSDTIGDLDNVNGNTALIHIKLGSNTYYINADSNKYGVSIFLKNKANPWILIENENGTNNKITNNVNKEPIGGFYIYKR